MKSAKRALMTMLLTLLLAPAAMAGEIVRATILESEGGSIGQVTLEDTPNGVLIVIRVVEGGLEPGPHAVHLHAVGDCQDVGTFSNAGGHIDITEKRHGLLHREGPHEGDLPNLYANLEGSVEAEMLNTRVRLRDGEAALLDEDGSALVIHTYPDDHMKQPIGGSGPRIGCAAFKP